MWRPLSLSTIVALARLASQVSLSFGSDVIPAKEAPSTSRVTKLSRELALSLGVSGKSVSLSITLGWDPVRSRYTLSMSLGLGDDPRSSSMVITRKGTGARAKAASSRRAPRERQLSLLPAGTSSSATGRGKAKT